MSHRYHNLIIDATNMFFRSVYRTLRVTKNFQDKFEKFCRFPIEDFLRRATSLVDEYGYSNSKVFFLFDNPDSAYRFRRIISEGNYKHTRRKHGSSEHVYMVLNILIDVLKCYSNNFRVVSSMGMEADDLAKPVVESLNPGIRNKCLFVSVDLDWARNINDRNFCHWFNWYKIVDEQIFRENYGFNPVGNSLKLYKAVHGDESDCIENAVPRLPKETLIDLVSRFDTVDELFRDLGTLQTSKDWKLKIKEAEKTIRINYQMVDFFPLESSLEDITFTCQKNQELLRQWYELIGSEMLLQETITYTDFISNFSKPRKVDMLPGKQKAKKELKIP